MLLIRFVFLNVILANLCRINNVYHNATMIVILKLITYLVLYSVKAKLIKLYQGYMFVKVDWLIVVFILLLMEVMNVLIHVHQISLIMRIKNVLHIALLVPALNISVHLYVIYNNQNHLVKMDPVFHNVNHLFMMIRLLTV